MTLLSEAAIKELFSVTQKPCVSLYMPTHEAGPDIRQDPIRLKNLLREAEVKLGEDDGELLEPARRLVEQQNFWQHQNQGLALFLAPGWHREYRLPAEFEELVTVGENFHLKPLLPLLTEDEQFYILALSQQQVRLLKATRFTVEEMELEGVPTSLEEALKYDLPQKQIQFHSTASGGQAPVFHGQGVGTTADDEKEAIHRYFQVVDSGITRILQAQPEKEHPLILAAVEYLQPIYREANSYGNLFPQGVKGNPEQLSARELRQKAWEVIAPHHQQERAKAMDKYHQLLGTGQATAELREIIPAAHNGQVETLFVDIHQQYWGRFEPESNQVEVGENSATNNDLLDFAAVHTLLQSGKVYALSPEEMPTEKAPLAATLRYPVTSGQPSA